MSPLAMTRCHLPVATASNIVSLQQCMAVMDHCQVVAQDMQLQQEQQHHERSGALSNTPTNSRSLRSAADRLEDASFEAGEEDCLLPDGSRSGVTVSSHGTVSRLYEVNIQPLGVVQAAEEGGTCDLEAAQDGGGTDQHCDAYDVEERLHARTRDEGVTWPYVPVAYPHLRAMFSLFRFPGPRPPVSPESPRQASRAV